MTRSGDDADVVLWRLVQTAHLARRRFEAGFAAVGLTGSGFGVLAALADGDDLTSADLARAILVRPQSMTALVRLLEDDGLVERPGPGGRGRATPVRLTDAGRDRLRQGYAVVARLHDPAVTGLGPDAAGELARLLGVVHTALDAAVEPEP
ncbi:MarR family winged helix-turn-helix transcriptional regulator [Nocardioides sp. CFH 31398]|uniref:MarR family winged helix-turn-helix transcriptional regulator n=1 Tax=Nocardioides sp. CFH 31398 TaxID=2919579 RepID=UPI001F064754|nr:MarR family transcriptional regulator [Nocardioides sp. CFH 31398]MCH1866498.1 MarR family transcriptional regulator [Nocardioides sp. CFH 31398]